MEYDATQSSSSSDSIELGTRKPEKERLTLADFLRSTGPADFNPALKNQNQNQSTNNNQPRPSRIPLDFQLSKLNSTLFATNKTRPSLPIKSVSSTHTNSNSNSTTNPNTNTNPISSPTNPQHDFSNQSVQKLRHAGTASHPDLASLVRVARKRSKTIISQPDSSLQPSSENPNPSTSSFHYSANLPSSSNLSSTTIAPRVTPLPKPKQSTPSSPSKATSTNPSSSHQLNHLNSQYDFNSYNNQSPSGPGCRNSAPITTSDRPSTASLQPARLARASTGSSRCYSISYSHDPGTDRTSQSTFNSQLASIPTESPYSPPSLSPSLDPPLSFTSGTGGTGLAGLVAAHKERRKAKDSCSTRSIRSINSDSDSIFLKSKSSSGQQSIYDFLRSTSHRSKRSTARSNASDTADETDEEGEDTRHIRRTLEPAPPAAFQYFHRLLPTSSALNVNYPHEPSRSVVMDRSASHSALNFNGQWAAWGGLNDTNTEPLDQHSSFHTNLGTVPLTPADMAKSAKLNLRNRSISKPNPPTSSHTFREESQGDAQANSWSSTMKKTSGFFKRRFGSTPGASESTTNLNDLVNIQHSRHFSSQSDHHHLGTESCPSSPAVPHSLLIQRPTPPPPPPVPTIPSSYIQNNSSTCLSPTQSDQRNNVKSGAQSARSSPSPLSPSPSQRKARERTEQVRPDPAMAAINRSRSASPPRHDAGFSAFKPNRHHHSHRTSNPEDPHPLTLHHHASSNIELNSQNSPRQRTSMTSLSAAVASLQPFDSSATKPSSQVSPDEAFSPSCSASSRPSTQSAKHSTPASQIFSVTGTSPISNQPSGSARLKSHKSDETGRDLTSPTSSKSNPFKRPLKPYSTEAQHLPRDSELSPRNDSLMSGAKSHEPLSSTLDQSTQGVNLLIQVNPDRGLSKQHSNLPSAGSTASFFSTMSDNAEEGKGRATEVTPKNPFHRQNSVSHTPPIGGPTRFQSPLPRSGNSNVLPHLDTSSAVTGRSTNRPPDSNRNSRAESLNDMRMEHPSNQRAAMAKDLSLPVWLPARSASAESCPASVHCDFPVHNPISPTSSESPWAGRQRSPHPYHDAKLTATPILTNRLRTETEESTMSNKTLNIHAFQDSNRATGDGHSGRIVDPSQQFDDTAEMDPHMNHTPSIRLVSAPTDGAAPSTMPPPHLGSPHSQPSSTHSGHDPSSPMLPEHHRNPFSPNWSGQTVPLGKDTTPVGLGLKMERSQDSPGGDPNPHTIAHDQEEHKNRVSRTGLDRTSSLSRSLASSSITSASPSTMPLRASGSSTQTGQEDTDGCSLGPVLSKQRTISTTSTMNSTKRSNDTRSTTHTSVHPNDFVDATLSTDENAKVLARRCWDEDERFIRREKLAEWLGSPDTSENQLPVLTLKHYMNCFAFHQLRIDMAFRKLCQKLHLKGETQQIDRILVEFSQRFWQQNYSNLYFSTDVVHALSYSILLLNTDLHIVDTTSRMSRSQFVKNTLETLNAELSSFEDMADVEHVIDTAERDTPMSMNEFVSYSRPASPGLRAGTIGRAHQASKKSSTDLDSYADSHSKPPHSTIGRPSIDKWRGPFRNGSSSGTTSSRICRRSGSVASSAHPFVMVNGGPEPPSDASRRGSNELSSPAASMAPQEGTIKPSQFSRALFEKEIEGLLKDIYTAIKTQPIFQGSNADGQQRTPSIGGTRSPGGLGAERPQPPFKRNSLRGLPGFGGLLAAHGADMYGPRSSSPTSSMAPSTMSGTSGPGGLAQSSSSAGSHGYTSMTSPSIGFASNLSQSIIREQTEEESKDDSHEAQTVMTDEELALLGAPWAKEGLLQRKQYWDSKGKRHKDKGWAQLFVVIHKGQLKMFQFGASGPSMSSSNQGSGDGPTVGGGNWLSNAQPMGELTLTHSLSSALPSGYNRDRPCAFVLTLANESSYFFQAGTADLVNEWVSTCNYWSARLSKEPLTGGVSNMEYGWNQVTDLAMQMLTRKSTDFKGVEEEEEKLESQTRTKKLRQKIIKPNSSTIGSIYSMSGSESVKGSVADLRLTNPNSQPPPSSPQPNPINSNVMINDWSAPIPPNSTSTLTEEVQLENLRKHSIYMQLELEKHNYLRKPMMSLYPPRSINFQKATNNWEKKSQYLLAEIIKYTTYIDALESGIHQKNEKRNQRLVQSLLENADS